MAWQNIAASETDANSPLNQTLMDKIRGNLEALHSGSGVTNMGLKSTFQEVYTATTGAVNIELASVGEFGFMPSFKTSSPNTKRWDARFLTSAYGTSDTTYKRFISLEMTGGTVTGSIYAKVRYVQASREEPVVWLLRNKSDGHVLAGVFDPEARGEGHPFTDYMDDPDVEVIALELKRSDKLRQRIFDNISEKGVLWQVNLGLFTGKLALKSKVEPLVGTDVGGCLHADGARCVDFELVDEQG